MNDILIKTISLEEYRKRLCLVRETLKNYGYSGFILPHEDEFQNEQLPLYNERLQWLTGFSGSAGIAVILEKEAAIFSDGRYTEQLRQQVDASSYECLPLESFSSWLKERVQNLFTYDPWTLTVKKVEELKGFLPSTSLNPYAGKQSNPIDEIWHEREFYKHDFSFEVYDYFYSGQFFTDKKQKLEAILKKEQAEGIIITHPASAAWFLNIRSTEVPYSGFPLIRLLVTQQGEVFIISDHPSLLKTPLLSQESSISFVASQEWPQIAKKFYHQKILIHKETFPQALQTIFEQQNIQLIPYKDPCLLWKACKNPIEVAGFRTAHQKDGCALIKFFYWLQQQSLGHLTEQDCIDQLYSFRKEEEHLKTLSFPTIAGAGPNGAIIHYRCTPSTNRVLQPADLLLLDSGGHYQEGTTDVTRTIALGEITEEQKDRYTRVLKGNIALALAHFPAENNKKGGTTGLQLDALARIALWEIGLDYAHGTGHGVGHCLNVHEGPQSISPRGAPVNLQEGMILSNEPGYYKKGEYGIRLENLMVVQKSPNEGFLQFETLTLIPFDSRLIQLSLLTEAERSWLNAYHHRVYEGLFSFLKIEVQKWLKKATLPL